MPDTSSASISAVDLFLDQRDPTHEFAWQMGVHPLDDGPWLLVDDAHGEDVAEIGRLIDSRPEEIICTRPEGTPACEELLDLVRRHPAVSTVGPSLVDPQAHPIERARRLVQEDLCVLERRERGWLLTAAAVAIPTAWDLPSKLGRPLDEIHAPVPRYDRDLAPRMGTFFDRLAVQRPMCRSNFTLTDDPSLRLDPPIRTAEADPTIVPATVADRVWLRVEYQTMRRLPETDAIVFTIRILRQSIAEAAERRDDFVPALLDRLAAIPPDVGVYKHSTLLYEPQLRAWAAGAGHRHGN